MVDRLFVRLIDKLKDRLIDKLIDTLKDWLKIGFKVMQYRLIEWQMTFLGGERRRICQLFWNICKRKFRSGNEDILILIVFFVALTKLQNWKCALLSCDFIFKAMACTGFS